jgi:hypothetical protein
MFLLSLLTIGSFAIKINKNQKQPTYNLERSFYKDYINSCRNVRLDGATLRADCLRAWPNTNYISTYLNLSLCFGYDANSVNKINPYTRNFYWDCKDCSLNGTVMSCKCPNNVWASVDLNKWVANNDGWVDCWY